MSRCLRCISLLLLALLPRQVFACSVCYGAPDALQTQGLNAGILVLLGVLAVVLGGFIAMIVGFIVRARRLSRTATA